MPQCGRVVVFALIETEGLQPKMSNGCKLTVVMLSHERAV